MGREITRPARPEPSDAEIARAVYSFKILLAMTGPHKGEYEWVVFWRHTLAFAAGGWAPTFLDAYHRACAVRLKLVLEEFPAGKRWA